VAVNGSAIQYKTKQDIVYTQLYDEIVSGGHLPGERLDLNEIAARYGTSRTPVREAMWRLESDGLITVAPHRGFVVSNLPVEEIAELYHIRAVLEGLASRLAAGRLSSEEASALRAHLEEMQTCLDGGECQSINTLNLPFHEIIFAAAKSPLLYRYISSLYAATARYRVLTTTWPGRAREIVAEHRALAEAIIAGDAGEAERIARLHQENNARTVIAVAHSLGETPLQTLTASEPATGASHTGTHSPVH
jgi:DNA-binding GntR family transcriptional regulator